MPRRDGLKKFKGSEYAFIKEWTRPSDYYSKSVEKIIKANESLSHLERNQRILTYVRFVNPWGTEQRKRKRR
jgi:hypothetical protein